MQNDTNTAVRRGLSSGIRRLRLWEMIDGGPPKDGLPWIADWRSFDIPNTIESGIRNAAPGLVAITLSMQGGAKMIDAAERAAKERGVRVLWWFGPNVDDIPEKGKQYFRRCVAEARARYA